jgi:hypothetical protein
MRRNIAILSILATSLMPFAAMAQTEAAAPPEGAPPVLDSAAPAAAPAAAPEAAPVAAPAAAPAGYPDEYALRPLTLSAMTFQGSLPVVLNLSKNAVLKPVWIPLDLRFGVTNELEVFLNHGVPGGSLIEGEGLCLGGTSRGCPKAYNNVNVGGVYSIIKSSGVELAGLLAVEVRQFSPDALLAADVGVAVKYVAAPVSVKLVPQIGIGLTKRSAGNKEQLAVPLQIAVQAAAPIAVFLDSGIFGPTSHFGDLYTVPIGIGASFLAMHGLDVGAEFMLPVVVTGISGNKAMDSRLLMIYAAWRSM